MEWNTVNGSSRAGHNPVQALARVNRVHGEKPGGRVVDLRGLADPLGDALATYSRAGGTGQAPADPRLQPLQPALAEASRTLGLSGFTLQGFVDILTSPGRGFSSQSDSLMVTGAAGVTDAGIGIGIDVTMGDAGRWDGGIKTDVVLTPGQFLVLGTTDAPGGGMRLVIVQAELAAGGS